MDFAALNQRIADQFPSLSPQLQQAARHVVDRPDDVALMSMRRLAVEAGVHPSTMVRLAKAFDCNSYADFREPFQQRLRAGPGGYLARARDLQARGAEGDAPDLVREILDKDIANLHQTFDENGAEKFITCGRTLAEAHTLYVLGLRSVFPVAFFFHYAYSMFRDNGVLLDGRGGTLADELRSFGPGDVIFAVSFEPYTFETVRAVDYAKDQGGTVVAMTDSLVSPLAKNADQTLIISNESPSVFRSIASAVAAMEALIVLMMAEGGDPVLDTIRDSEGQLESFDSYWHDHRGKRGKSAGRKAKLTPRPKS